GANSAANEVANNYLKHKGEGIKKSEQEMLKIATAECLAAGAGSDACSTRSSLLQLSAMRDQVITAACSGGASADCSTAVRGATAEGYQVLFTKEGKASEVAFGKVIGFFATSGNYLYKALSGGSSAAVKTGQAISTVTSPVAELVPTAEKILTPSSFGKATIAEDPVLLGIWNDSL
nr:hypothetical protein [Tanacetum cinerariifolium]